MDIVEPSIEPQYAGLLEDNIEQDTVCLLVYDITNTNSFHELENTLNKWIGAHAKRWPDMTLPPYMVVGTHADEYNKRRVLQQQAEELAKKLRCGTMESSAKLHSGVETPFVLLIWEMRNRQRARDARWV